MTGYENLKMNQILYFGMNKKNKSKYYYFFKSESN